MLGYKGFNSSEELGQKVNISAFKTHRGLDLEGGNPIFDTSLRLTYNHTEFSCKWSSGSVGIGRTLRSASDTLSLQIPPTRLSTVGFRSFFVFGPFTWDDLPLPV